MMSSIRPMAVAVVLWVAAGPMMAAPGSGFVAAGPDFMAPDPAFVTAGQHFIAPGPAFVALGRATKAPPLQVRTDTTRPRYTAADVRFVQGMIAHHGQALTMTALVAARSSRPELRLLAERIDVSQRDEIAMMRRWLEQRHETVPDLAAHAGHHDSAGGQPLMPGMLTAEELARLAGATGAGFDRLFLEFMIRHHEGALTMVARLFTTQGSGQEPQLFGFASDVDADQRAEIKRMRALLGAM